ncbi:MAG: OsmC family peroxiredoxin [Bdellovibrio sp.]|nr:OsmC family peroxiredoxin [Bdellovibrio sp.]
MERKATAVWHGNLQNGIGHISTESQTLKNTPYSFSTRFESDLGTNPEELIAAAHASCFTMALAAALGKEGIHADSLETSAVVSLKKNGENFTIASSKLRLRASVSDIDAKHRGVFRRRLPCDFPRFLVISLVHCSYINGQPSLLRLIRSETTLPLVL